MNAHQRDTFFQNQGTFFAKLGHFYCLSYFQKKAEETSPQPPFASSAPVLLLLFIVKLYSRIHIFKKTFIATQKQKPLNFFSDFYHEIEIS